jgi:hypothetical protein
MKDKQDGFKQSEIFKEDELSSIPISTLVIEAL